jgi:hypothetical protein
MIRKSGHRISLATNAKRLRGDHAQNKKLEQNGKKAIAALATWVGCKTIRDVKAHFTGAN